MTRPPASWSCSEGTNGSALGDTWAWTGSTWTEVASTGPQARYVSTLAYDPAVGQLVLFGGFNGSVRLGDTWEWNGTAWTEAATTGPPARADAVLAYDPATSQMVLYGGLEVAPPGSYLQDTWNWNGSTWTELATTGPPARQSSRHDLRPDGR